MGDSGNVWENTGLALNCSKASVSVDDDSLLSSLLNVFYHKTRRNTLVLVYQQDILILDLDIKQTIAIVSLERSTCPFVDVSNVKIMLAHINNFRISQKLPW